MKINEVSDNPSSYYSTMMSISLFLKEHAYGSHYDVNKALVEDLKDHAHDFQTMS